jgi:Tfp pilus assembly protein PilV
MKVMFLHLHARVKDNPENGFSLAEVLVALTVITMGIIATGALLVSTIRAVGTNQSRAGAANAARNEIAELRMLPAASITQGRTTKTVTYGTRSYEVSTYSKWVNLGGDSDVCSSGHGSVADYVRSVVTVTWGDTQIQPVRMTTLVSPSEGSVLSTKGSIAVTVADVDGDPVPNVDVTAVSDAGGTLLADNTDDQGCVFFANLPPGGTWNLTLNKEGYVDPQGTQKPTSATSVVKAETSTVTFLYDVAGDIQMSLNPIHAGTPTGLGVTISSTYAPSEVLRTTIWPVFRTGLFPASGGYEAWLGVCNDADPSAMIRPGQISGLRQNVTVYRGDKTSLQLEAADVYLMGVPQGKTVYAVHQQESAGYCATNKSVFTVGKSVDVSKPMQTALPYGTWVFTLDPALVPAKGTVLPGGKTVTLSPRQPSTYVYMTGVGP